MVGPMRPLGLLLLLGACGTTRHDPAPPAPREAPLELAGLWKAKLRAGPDARGPLVVRREGSAFVADMMGHALPVRADGGALSFELPDGQGSFRGKVRGDAIRGHWFPARSLTRGAVFVSPVRLAPDGPDRWRGVVEPFDDAYTIYLMTDKRPDGTLGAVVRNPEQNFGIFLDPDRLVRDGAAIKLASKKEDVARGAYDAESKVLTLGFPSRGGSYDFRRDGDESAFYPRGKRPARYAYRPPPRRDDGWPTGTLDEVGIDRAAVERLVQSILDAPIDSLHAPQIEGLLLARHGKLVLEEYFHGAHRDRLHDTRSASKSMTATLVGAAIQAGAPLTMSTPVYESTDDPKKRAMTLEHLLTMSSGYYCDDSDPKAPGNEETMQDQEAERDWYRFTLNLPMAMAPGEKAVYCSIDPNLALSLVARATGESVFETFDRLVGAPMKIERYGWFTDPLSRPYGGGGIHFLPRDFMKMGELMRTGGTWQGTRVLSREFVATASAPLYHLRNLTYGYLWWGIDYPYKDRTVHAFFAGGNGGQGVMVIPALDLVIATYGGNYNDRVALALQQETTPKYILPAVREQGDDPNVPVVPRDYKTPYGPSPDGSRFAAAR
jgi:CubicO group peptidase (beta-lactamase class C family)